MDSAAIHRNRADQRRSKPGRWRCTWLFPVGKRHPWDSQVNISRRLGVQKREVGWGSRNGSPNTQTAAVATEVDDMTSDEHSE